MDDEYSAERAQIKDTARTSGEHLVAGIQGLGHGIVGGLTSVFTRTAEGAVNKGVTVRNFMRPLEYFSAWICFRDSSVV